MRCVPWPGAVGLSTQSRRCGGLRAPHLGGAHDALRRYPATLPPRARRYHALVGTWPGAAESGQAPRADRRAPCARLARAQPARSASVPSLDEREHRRQVRPGFAVLGEGGDPLADPPMRLGDPRAGRRRRGPLGAHRRQPQVQRLGRAQQLDRQDLLDVPQHDAGVAGRRGPHRDVVLLVRRRGDGVRRRRVGQDLVLGREGGGRVLDDHQAAVPPRVGRQEGRQAAVQPRVQEQRRAPLGDGAQLGQRQLREVERQARSARHGSCRRR